MTKDVAKSYAIKLLSYRMYTVLEMSEKLRAKGADAEVTDEVLFEFITAKILDDKKYAELYIQDSLNIKQKGFFRIQTELAQKGIDKAVIQRAFEASGVDEFAVLLNYIEQRTAGAAFETYNDVEKLKAHLYRRGFSADIIGRAIKESGITWGNEELN